MCVCVCSLKLIRENMLSNSFHRQLEMIQIPMQTQDQWYHPPGFFFTCSRGGGGFHGHLHEGAWVTHLLIKASLVSCWALSVFCLPHLYQTQKDSVNSGILSADLLTCHLWRLVRKLFLTLRSNSTTFPHTENTSVFPHSNAAGSTYLSEGDKYGSRAMKRCSFWVLVVILWRL